LHRSGPRHPGHRARALGWLHHRIGPGPGPGRRAAAGARVRHPEPRRRGHDDLDRPLEGAMTAFHVNERIEILDPSGPGHARRRAMTLAEYLGADEETIGRAGIVTTELAQNLVKHTRGGEILLRAPPGG